MDFNAIFRAAQKRSQELRSMDINDPANWSEAGMPRGGNAGKIAFAALRPIIMGGIGVGGSSVAPHVTLGGGRSGGAGSTDATDSMPSLPPEPPQSQPDVPEPPKPVAYQVKPGDTLWGIAKKVYGTPLHAGLIASANKIQNPNIIKPGQVLVLPEIGGA